MEESVETALLEERGRIAALSIAVCKLIELTEHPEAARTVIGDGIAQVLGVFEASTDERHAILAGGLRSQMEDLIATD